MESEANKEFDTMITIKASTENEDVDEDVDEEEEEPSSSPTFSPTFLPTAASSFNEEKEDGSSGNKHNHRCRGLGKWQLMSSWEAGKYVSTITLRAKNTDEDEQKQEQDPSSSPTCSPTFLPTVAPSNDNDEEGINDSNSIRRSSSTRLQKMTGSSSKVHSLFDTTLTLRTTEDENEENEEDQEDPSSHTVRHAYPYLPFFHYQQ